jgi:hypothetical protein
MAKKKTVSKKAASKKSASSQPKQSKEAQAHQETQQELLSKGRTTDSPAERLKDAGEPQDHSGDSTIGVHQGATTNESNISNTAVTTPPQPDLGERLGLEAGQAPDKDKKATKVSKEVKEAADNFGHHKDGAEDAKIAFARGEGDYSKANPPPPGVILDVDEEPRFNGTRRGNMVVVNEDVWRRVFPIGSKRPTYILVFSGGAEFPETSLKTMGAEVDIVDTVPDDNDEGKKHREALDDKDVPNKSDDKATWVKFAVSKGMTKEDAEDATKDALIDKYGN